MSVKDRQSAEVEINQEAVYLYIKDRVDVTGKECVEALQFFEKGKKYLRWLETHGHLTSTKKVIEGRLHRVYNAALPYARPVHEAPSNLTDSQQTLLQKATTTYRLLDQPRHMHKSERPKRSTTVGIGSGLAMFDSY
jgi:hypothetical protein